MVTREDLRRQLWCADVFVDFDNNLNTVIAQLREALSDSADHPRFIETLPRRGYRFLKNVSELPLSPEKSRAKRARFLVLPFLNLSGDQAQEYFSDAITDEIITALAGVAPEQLAVIARTTAMHYGASAITGTWRAMACAPQRSRAVCDWRDGSFCSIRGSQDDGCSLAPQAALSCVPSLPPRSQDEHRLSARAAQSVGHETIQHDGSLQARIELGAQERSQSAQRMTGNHNLGHV